MTRQPCCEVSSGSSHSRTHAHTLFKGKKMLLTGVLWNCHRWNHWISVGIFNRHGSRTKTAGMQAREWKYLYWWENKEWRSYKATCKAVRRNATMAWCKTSQQFLFLLLLAVNKNTTFIKISKKQNSTLKFCFLSHLRTQTGGGNRGTGLTSAWRFKAQ